MVATALFARLSGSILLAHLKSLSLSNTAADKLFVNCSTWTLAFKLTTKVILKTESLPARNFYPPVKTRVM
jgi:hypothetical protein